MAKTEGKAYQLHLNEPIPEIVFRFDEGTVIYPWGSHRGMLRSPVMARATNMERNGLQVYKSLTRIDLYFSQSYWSLPEGTLFGAYSNKKHKVRIP